MPIILLAAACAKEPDTVGPETHKVPLNITIETKAGGSGEDGDGLDVNSVRVAVFKKLGGAASSDLVVLNEFYPFGFDVDDTNRADKDTVTVRPVLELDLNCDNYYVYVVLNEEGYTLKGGAVLSSSLGNLGNRDEMDDLLATPAIYPGAGVKEAPFCLMSASKVVSFGTDKDRPVDVKFNAADNKAVRRNMAQITVGSIKSDISDPSADRTFEVELPKIFVLSVDLVNVPSDMTWSDAEGGITGGTRTIPIGTKNAQGYYDRVWHGSVYRDVDVTVTKREETDAKYYRSQWGWNFTQHQEQNNNIDKNGWSFIASSAAVFKDSNITKNDDLKKVYASAKNHRKAIDNNYAANNSVGKLISDLNTLYNSGDHDFEENLKTIITATGYASGTPSSAYCSNETWSVSLDDSYYVPENISSSAGSATCIKVRLAVASPSIGLTGVAASALPAPGDIAGTGTSSYYLDNTYYEKDGSFNIQSFDLATTLSGKIYTTNYNNGKYEKPTETNANMPNLFEKFGHIVNADDEMIEYTTNEDKTNNYKVYIDGFYRLTQGLTGTTTVNQDQPGATFSWGIPTSGTNVKEFYIPVNNNLDGTYDIKRNTRYTVNLTVTKNTYDAATKASGSGDDFGFGISAEVTTERLTENED